LFAHAASELNIPGRFLQRASTPESDRSYTSPKKEHHMKYRLLGRSGLRVSELCLGTMTFGDDWGWGASRDAARSIYDAYRAAGGNFVDTANLYTNGTSEKFVGEFVKDHRDSMVIATKYTNAGPGTDANAGGNQRKNMVQSVEASLKRLGTDRIDLYWLHIWDQLTPVDEVMRAFDDLVKAGKVVYVGVSDAPGWWVAQANTLANLRGWSPFIGLQIEYSLVERTVERELIPMAAAMGIGVTAWSPLAGGTLSGKYHGGKDQPADGRYSTEMMAAFRAKSDRIDRIVTAAKKVAGETGTTPPQVSIAWLLHRPQPVIPIIGMRKLPQLEDNLKSLELKLTLDQLKTLDDASAIDMGFPHSFYENPMVRTFIYGGLRDQILA
jgi:aryl-alcohol dehydrogenase-like predicted oxidoreductase